MTTTNCPVCDQPLVFPADPDGHAEGCRWPSSMTAASARFARAVRQLGTELAEMASKLPGPLGRAFRSDQDRKGWR